MSIITSPKIEHVRIKNIVNTLELEFAIWLTTYNHLGGEGFEDHLYAALQ